MNEETQNYVHYKRPSTEVSLPGPACGWYTKSETTTNWDEVTCPKCLQFKGSMMTQWSKEQMDTTESVIRIHILRDWPRDRIKKFAKHLLGDECQLCESNTQTIDLIGHGQNRPYGKLQIPKDIYEQLINLHINGITKINIGFTRLDNEIIEGQLLNIPAQQRFQIECPNCHITVDYVTGQCPQCDFRSDLTPASRETHRLDLTPHLSRIVSDTLQCSLCPSEQAEVNIDSTPDGWFIECDHCKMRGPVCPNVNEAKAHWNNMSIAYNQHHNNLEKPATIPTYIQFGSFAKSCGLSSEQAIEIHNWFIKMSTKNSNYYDCTNCTDGPCFLETLGNVPVDHWKCTGKGICSWTKRKS